MHERFGRLTVPALDSDPKLSGSGLSIFKGRRGGGAGSEGGERGNPHCRGSSSNPDSFTLEKSGDPQW